MSDAPASNTSASNASASSARGNDAPVSNGSASNEQAVFQKLADGLATQLIGHESLIERLLIALLSGGHVLLEGPCLLYTSPSPRDRTRSRMPSSA